ncbi:HNH endonuclease [Tenacibaculum haliotis]|uniref:HNH endonuclease n=1 Tax=Tenacibaculum haliotis TaxID=1888914 RepID=UPI0021AFCC14|nr:HNH endonuclease [Tenacibaculum haliotis]MCT4699936.1 HNH endonuclease [Tenacibaculum haliotis]
MKKIILIIFLATNLPVSSQKTKIITAGIKAVSKKGISKKISTKTSIKSLETFRFSPKKSLEKSTYKLSPKESKVFLNRVFSEKRATEVYKNLGHENINRIHKLLPKNSPKELKKVFISDFEKNPKLLTLYENDNLLNCCYKKIMNMGASYRRDLTFIKQIKQGVSPIKINTINQGKAGKTINGVFFRLKEITLPNGLRIKGVFPDFKKHSIFEVTIPNHSMLKTDNSQFNLAFLKLKNSLKRSTELQEKFPKKIVDEISSRKLSISKSNNRVKGHVWHHTEDGTLQLIKREIHDAARHTGGRAIYGAGSTLR